MNTDGSQHRADQVRPDIESESILRALREAYRLPLVGLEFLTTGWASLCYRVATGPETANGAPVDPQKRSYLLKVYDEGDPKPVVAGSRDFYLPLTRQLHERGLLTQIPCPVKTWDGRFSVQVSSNNCRYLLILFHFIEGETVGFGTLSDAILSKLAPLVGCLHRSANALDLVNPLVDDFKIAFEKTLPEWLYELSKRNPQGREAIRGFQGLLLPRQDEILGYLDRLKTLQEDMRRKPADLVVCHTDLHGGNLLIDEGGNLHILDWENAQLAPREQDLYSFALDDRFWDVFWPAYKEEAEAEGAGPIKLDGIGVAFYQYRRCLEDIAEWLQQLLYAPRDEEHERGALHYAGLTLDELSGLEAKLIGLEGALQALR